MDHAPLYGCTQSLCLVAALLQTPAAGRTRVLRAQLCVSVRSMMGQQCFAIELKLQIRVPAGCIDAETGLLACRGKGGEDIPQDAIQVRPAQYACQQGFLGFLRGYDLDGLHPSPLLSAHPSQNSNPLVSATCQMCSFCSMQ